MSDNKNANGSFERRDDGFIRDEDPNEGWDVTPLDADDDLEEMDIFECDEDDDDDGSFYTAEDYENCPVLRMMMRDLGGEDPLGRDYVDLESAAAPEKANRRLTAR